MHLPLSKDAPNVDPLPRPRRSPAGISVAELVSLHSLRVPADAAVPDPTAPAVSVAALLRREGRGPHAADRPLQPRGHTRGPVEVPAQRRGVRKAAIAAGALFAASAVFGATALDESRSTRDRDAGDALAVPEPYGGAGSAGTDQADDGVGLATALAPLPAAEASSPDTRPVASGADIGGDALAGLFGAGPAGGAPTPADPAGGSGTAGGGPAAGGLPGGGAVGTPGDGASGPTGTGADRPGAGNPAGGGNPGGGNPGGGSGGGSGPTVTVALPDLATPELTLPPIGGPGVTLTAAGIDAPEITLADGPTPSVSRSAVVTPDLAADDVEAGPVALTGGSATLPDVTVEGTEPVAGAGPEVTAPALRLSEARVETPDPVLGDTTVELPDPGTPELALPAVPIGPTLTGVPGAS